MAAPPEKTIKNLTGKWSLNKELSDSTENALALQGIGWVVRKGVAYASITLDVNQYEAPPKPPNEATDIVTHIDIEQTVAGMSSTHERRCLDQTWREHSDYMFGEVKGVSRWKTLDEIEDAYLKNGWETEGQEAQFVNTYVESKTAGWTADQIWGFQVINGERRYCRNVVVAKGDERCEFRMVYDYTP